VTIAASDSTDDMTQGAQASWVMCCVPTACHGCPAREDAQNAPVCYRPRTDLTAHSGAHLDRALRPPRRARPHHRVRPAGDPAPGLLRPTRSTGTSHQASYVRPGARAPQPDSPLAVAACLTFGIVMLAATLAYLWVAATAG